MSEQGTKLNPGGERRNYVGDSALTMVLCAIHGVRKVCHELEQMFARGDKLILNMAAAVDSTIHLANPEWFKMHLENGNIRCYLYGGSTVEEELTKMLFLPEGQAGFTFSAIGCTVNWTGLHQKPSNLMELLRLVEQDEALSGYGVAMSGIIKLLDKYAVPRADQAKDGAKNVWWPREGVTPDVSALSKLLDRPEISQAMERAGKDVPQWHRRSAGLGFLLWLNEEKLLKDDELQKLVIETFYKGYIGAQALQKDCVDENGNPLVALSDLLDENQEAVWKAFCEIYRNLPATW